MSRLPRLLDVEVLPKGLIWEWRLHDQTRIVMSGRKKSRKDAQSEGDSALFQALSAGLFPDPNVA
jgi:hypothetical protein